MKTTTVGIDLAKNVFQVHGVNEHSKKMFNRQIRRNRMIAFFTQLAPCLIGMEACSGTHYWARRLQATNVFIFPVRWIAHAFNGFGMEFGNIS